MLIGCFVPSAFRHRRLGAIHGWVCRMQRDGSIMLDCLLWLQARLVLLGLAFVRNERGHICAGKWYRPIAEIVLGVCHIFGAIIFVGRP